MRYFYARVSSRDQSLGRQIQEFKKMGYIEECLYCDKASGKDFDRPEYIKLKAVLRDGDELVVKELDRLGRDKEMIKSELRELKGMGVIVRILDIPTTLIDFGEQDWIGDMVTNILLEVLSSVAEQERKKIKARQREGIDAMKVVDGRRIGKSGKPIGRVARELDFSLVEGMDVEEACSVLGISRATYYRRRYAN